MTFSGGTSKKQPPHGDRHPLPHQHGPAELLADHEALTVDHRSVRNPDGNIEDSVDRDALEQLDVADADSNVDTGHHTKITP